MAPIPFTRGADPYGVDVLWLALDPVAFVRQILDPDSAERHALSVQNLGERMSRGVLGTALGGGRFFSKQFEALLNHLFRRPETALGQLLFH